MMISSASLEEVWKMRKEVMYPEHTIDQVKLPDDERGDHFGLYEENKLISVVSVFIKNEELQFRKFATRAKYQHKGYGTALLQHVMQIAHRARCKKVWCNSRTSANSFYEKFGMKAVGDTWQAEGHEFIKMEKQL
jgi:phosphoribosylformimino-5-aminoimidazole carboxamide ribotide isomerase